MFNKTNNSKRNAAKPAIETLESRQHLSAAPLNYDGQYVMYQGTTRYELDFKHTSTTQYTGDARQGSTDLKLTATESNNKLTGTLREPSGKLDAFSASLSGRNLTVSIANQKLSYEKRVTPLTPHTVGGLFEFDTPAGWTAKANTGGMLIKSADSMQQVSVETGVMSGYLTPQGMLTYAQQHGTKVKLAKASQVSNLGGGLWFSDEVAEVTFNVGKTSFTSDVLIASVYNANYNITKIGMGSITAPTAVFAKDGAVMLDVMKSIRQLPAKAAAAPAVVNAAPAGMKAAATPAAAGLWSSFDYGYTFTNGFYDPGIAGDWAYGYTTAWVSPFVAAEQVYVAQSSAAFDNSLAAWHDQFMNTDY